jgi:hypothetical protein
MFTHPDLLNDSVKQHFADLRAEADRARLLNLAMRRRRSERAARKNGAVKNAAGVAPATSSVPSQSAASVKTRTIGVGGGR